MFSNYLLYQLTVRYIGSISGRGGSELLPGSYLYIFESEEFTNLETLTEGTRLLNNENELNSTNNILDIALKFGENHELRSEELSYELSEVRKYLEKRQGFEVFFGVKDSNRGKPLLYFFPKRMLKLKKLLPPNLDQLGK